MLLLSYTLKIMSESQDSILSNLCLNIQLSSTNIQENLLNIIHICLEDLLVEKKYGFLSILFKQEISLQNVFSHHYSSLEKILILHTPMIYEIFDKICSAFSNLRVVFTPFYIDELSFYTTLTIAVLILNKSTTFRCMMQTCDINII